MLSEHSKRRRPELSFDEYRKLPTRMEQFRFVTANDLRSARQVREAYADAKKTLKSIRHERYLISKEERPLKKLISAADSVELLSGRQTLHPSEQKQLSAARQKIHASGMSISEIRSAQASIGRRIQENTEKRKNAYNTVRLLKDLVAGLPKITRGVKVRIAEIAHAKQLEQRTAQTNPRHGQPAQRAKRPAPAAPTVRKERRNGDER